MGYSVQEARDAEGKRKGQKRETAGRFFNMLPGLDTTFKDLTAWYLDLKQVQRLASYKSIRCVLGLFNKDFGERLVHTLKPQDLENYQDKRRNEGKKLGTIDNDMSIVHGMIKKAYDNDMTDDRALKAFRPIRDLLKKGENARNRLVSVSEYLSLLEHSSAHMKAVITIAYNTGMRRGEILKLKWSHIDREAGFLRLPAEITKERNRRDVPMNHHVKGALASLPRVLHEEAVFTYRGVPVTSAKRTFEASCRRAGIVCGMKAAGGLRFHDLRGSFKTHCLLAGVDKSLRDKLVGHALGGMDSHYIRLGDDHLRAAMDRFTAWLDQGISSQSLPKTLPNRT